MKKVLSQDEIDSMIHTARSGAPDAAVLVQPAAVTPWDGRLAGRIGQEQMQSLTRLHQNLRPRYAARGSGCRVIAW